MTQEYESRLIELETRVAFQDDLLATLNRDSAALSDEVTRLREACADLRKSLDAIRIALQHDVADEAPPPHY
jgi:SlyX protein